MKNQLSSRGPIVVLIACVLATLTVACGEAAKYKRASNARNGGAQGGAKRDNIYAESKSEAAQVRTKTAGVQDGRNQVPPATGETYDRVYEHPFIPARLDPLSTFATDVDTASYSNIRRFLNDGQLPPKDAVRIEEMINYFTYEYPQPDGDHPVSVITEVGECPWNDEHRLVRIGLQARRIDMESIPPRNFVFLIDVSGSMQSERKLPLVKRALDLLVNQLTEQDKVAIVVYASQVGLKLPTTPGSDKETIRSTINRLDAGGSTYGSGGIQLAYQTARESFIEGGLNRVILCTDGDFNVGTTSDRELVALIEDNRESGVFLSVLGFGMGNLKDSKLEKLADHGNGNYAYIDSWAEARKYFVEEGAALVTVAKDVKIQVEFRPEKVKEYRLIGYENRLMSDHQFRDDRKDAGDLGEGHSVTAIYEIVPSDYRATEPTEILTVRMRYKLPDQDAAQELEFPGVDIGSSFDSNSPDHRFAVAVACFGMLLRDSSDRGSTTYDDIRRLAESSIGPDLRGHRAEFIKLVDRAEQLSRR